MVSKCLNVSPLWDGDRCTKDADHRAVHQSDRASVRNEKELSTERCSIWPLHGTVMGWSDPTFCHLLVAKRPLGSLQPRQKIPLRLARVRLGMPGETIQGNNYFLHLQNCHLFTRLWAYGIRSQRFGSPTSEKVTSQEMSNRAGGGYFLFAALEFLNRNLGEKLKSVRTTHFRFVFCTFFSLWREQFL